MYEIPSNEASSRVGTTSSHMPFKGVTYNVSKIKLIEQLFISIDST